MKHIIGLLAMLLPILSSAQSPPVKPLNIGDRVPDITITNVYNYPTSTIRLSDLKGKLVILDFWSTWCGSCIESLPKMHQLQKEFGNQLQVILVNTYAGDSIQRVKPFFEKRKGRTGLAVTLPFSLLQSFIKEYFPYKFVPHYVWIGKDAVVVAITSQMEVTKENIRAALNGNLNDIHIKNDILDFNSALPLLVNGNGGNENQFLYRSLISTYIEGLGNLTDMKRDSNGKVVKFLMVNTSPLFMIRTAWPDALKYSKNRIFIETDSAERFRPLITFDSPFYTNSYCYEMTIPPSTVDEFREYMRQDLERYFGVKAVTEVREIRCLVIKKYNAAKIGAEEKIAIAKQDKRKYLQNQPISVLLEILNAHPAFPACPVINEAMPNNNIDLILPTDFYDLSFTQLKSFLHNAGIEFTEEKRNIEVGVIKDK